MEHVTEQQLTRRQSTVWRALRAAAPQTIPVLAGYFVLGMGYGIYVQSLGLPVWMPMLMGTVVYGGSLEFVLASLLLSAFSPLSAFLMALMIQARHLFYGLAMLERYKGYGLRSFYMIFAMSDETFSITCSAEPPEGVDRGWFMFFITLLDQCYWVASAGLGAVVGSVLPFSTEGVDFVMTAMFTVIFLNQWEKDRQHYSALIGLAAPLAKLLQIIQRQVVASHVQQAVEQRRAVPGGEHKPVPVGSVRVSRVVLEMPRPQRVGHGGCAQRQAGVAAVGLLHHVD